MGTIACKARLGGQVSITKSINTRTIACASHADSINVLKWFATLSTNDPEIINILLVDTVIPRARAKDVPFH